MRVMEDNDKLFCRVAIFYLNYLIKINCGGYRGNI